MSQPLLSVIVPCYNVEKYVEKCLRSILEQTYTNLEIICVNDCSSDSTLEKLEGIKELDSRVIIISHEKNRGLFQARVTGLHHATGTYVSFIDSDDHIDEDFFRCLIEKANVGNYDIVMGDTVHEDEGGYRWVHAAYSDIMIEDREEGDVLGKLLSQEGYCFIWHAVWNKLYKREIVDEALPFFDEINEHIIMGEDVLFSCVLHYYARSFSKTEYAYYFYVQRKGASTALDNNVNKFNKSIGDLERVFYYVNLFFDENNVKEEDRKHFDKWRDLYSRYWYDNVFYSDLANNLKQRLYKKIKIGFKVDKVVHTQETDHWFYKLSIPFDNRYIQLKKNIRSYDIISIDIFDTLVLRKTYKPTDIFLFMDKWFMELSGRQFDFSHARIHAEATARKVSKFEEVTLDEIYEVFQKENGISAELANKAQAKEIEVEKNLCFLRKSIVDIIRYAHSLSKTVVLTSDFYFSRDQLEDLLNSLNVEYDDIILSSEHRVMKASGKLFDVLQEKYNKESILHIGNSWESDYVKAKEAGIDAHFYASTTAAFMYDISDINSTDSTRIYKRPTGLWDNFEHSMDFFEVRCLLANVASKLYDNPYTSFIKFTDFSGEARFFGYYALGMHLWGVSKWLYEHQLNKKSNIHFVARDGYLPMLAYNVFNSDNSAAQSNYFYASRKSLLPLCWVNKNDTDSMIAQIKKATPNQLFRWFSPLLDEHKRTEIESALISSWKNTQISGDSLYEFITETLAPCYSELKKEAFCSTLKKYYGSFIKEKDVIFDIGYSGRSLIYISQLLNFSIDGYFVHRINDQFSAKQNCMGIRIHSFYDYTPSITGVVRELLFSKQSPSCIGFDLSNGVKPKFEKDLTIYPGRFAIEEVQRWALELVKDVVPIYKMAPQLFSARSSDVSAPYEYMLHCSSAQDREYFSSVKFEDDVYYGKSSMKVTEVWQNDINYHHVMRFPEAPASVVPVAAPISSGEPLPTLNYDATKGWSKVKKAFYYFFFDNRTFRKKVKEKFSRKK